MSYVLINGIPLILRKISKGRIIPPNYYEDSEEWIVPPGSVLPEWMWVIFYDLFILYTNMACSCSSRRILGRTTDEDTRPDSLEEKDSSDVPTSTSGSVESRPHHDRENKDPNPGAEPEILEKDRAHPDHPPLTQL